MPVSSADLTDRFLDDVFGSAWHRMCESGLDGLFAVEKQRGQGRSLFSVCVSGYPAGGLIWQFCAVGLHRSLEFGGAAIGCLSAVRRDGRYVHRSLASSGRDVLHWTRTLYCHHI